MRSSRIWLLCFLIAAAIPSLGCRRAASNASKAEEAPDRYSSPCLVDVTESLGVRFRHDVGPLDSYPMPQIMGSGGALLDFDNDDDLDLLLISGVAGTLDEKPTGTRLYRQDAGNQFTDVTSESGIADEGVGMGCAVADIDNDGDLDIYMTRYGNDSLYVNQGNGRFVDVSSAAGIANPQWSTAASFFDYDRDGWLDLFVVNYVDFFPGSICEDGAGRRDFCGPESLSGTASKLYRNVSANRAGEGPVFEDVTVASGIARRVGKGLGVICRDFDMDGRLDIFVANDGEENFLWIQHDGFVFSNEAMLRGVALNRFGEAEANMGIVADDFNRDGFSDMFITHLREESNTLYHGAQFGQFQDQTVASGFSVTSLPFTGFGVACNDLDHDADLDLVIVNGGVKRGPRADSSDVDDFWRDYAQRNELYLNDGRGIFQSELRLGGSDFAQRVEVSRGLLSGDIDNDGDVDFVVTNCAGPARIYRNDFPKLGNWLRIEAFDSALKRTAIGAQVQVIAGKLVINREVNPSTGYLSSNDPRLHFGLGKAPRYDAIRVYWPDGDGQLEEFPGGQPNQHLKLIRGTGRKL